MKKECGAKARTNNHQPCKRLPMVNGRCRLHGGLSTGPKTIEGRKQAKRAVLKHGFYTRDAIKERKQIKLMIMKTKEDLSNLFK